MDQFDRLANDGWIRVPEWLENSEALALKRTAENLHARGLFKRAGVGKAGEARVADDVRKDEILWLERNRDPSIDRLFDRLEELRAALNREFFLGLKEFEAHFAVYPPGGSYARHKDRFRTDEARTMSAVVYLNETWLPDDGGELVIHRNGEHRIEPLLGSLALFKSDEIEHEVAPSVRQRWSVAIWFRR